MKINLISDLHIDFDRARQLDLPGGEVLLLAGDLCEVTSINPRFRLGTTLEALSRDEDIALYDFKAKTVEKNSKDLLERLNIQLSKYNKVYSVLGNHEHYNCNFNLTSGFYKDVLPNVILLEDSSVLLSDKVRLFGGTLWSDLDKHSPFTEMRSKDWSDYVAIKAGYANRKLETKDTYDAFEKTIAAIYKCATDNPNQEIIVMTHFAPSEQSVPAKYKNNADNGFFYSSLEDVILDNENIKVWCHGHMHSRSDYMIGQCRVICNSRGYVQGFQMERTGFDPGFSFEI